jgi:DNA polymerase III sliding clamp (beta) subunit (PCNA family)
VYGELKKGKISDIKFQEIEDYLKKIGVYSFLKNTSKLESEKQEITIKIKSSEMEKIEEEIVKKYETEDPSKFNDMILPLMDALNIEKQEGEKTQVFENRLFSEASRILGVNL